MADDSTTRGWVTALFEWLAGPQPSNRQAGDTEAAGPERSRIGHYTITGKLGAGGMGIVYEARDERLDRVVALKTMALPHSDATARRRFWREARAAASVNHPHICQTYDVGEDGGEFFIAMELLEGEPLGARLARGPLSVAETLPIALQMLAALSALHARGLVHRDLKPSNVYLTPHGVKVLDFGLARPGIEPPAAGGTVLTRPGMVAGTPRYMAPEQVTGEPVDARTDLFAAGAMLFEMLAGRPAFTGRGVVEILHATLHEQPPALLGPPAVAGIDRVIRRALAKRPDGRPPSAEAMAGELRAIPLGDSDSRPAVAQALTRLVVLPFRILRPDPETDFLAFSLADAIATSLSGIGSIVVRSNAAAARTAGEGPDLKALAAEADVDRVVLGTLLRSGDRLRASAQLVEAPSGTLLTAHTVESSLGDLFQLQDDIARRVVEALSLPLSGPSPAGGADTPHDPRAYELYLRANELARRYEGLMAARELYEQCLALDPAFAPAWAHLGRCHRVLGKFIEAATDSETRAEEAFRHALTLNPRLSITHKFYANLEAETGQAIRALVRLLDAAGRHGNDPELFAGLVHACRYCGLYDESIAAHGEARRLDPNVPTSLLQTWLMAYDLERLLAAEPPPLATNADEGMRVIGLGLAGRRDEARRMLAGMTHIHRVPALRWWVALLGAWLDRQPDQMLAAISADQTVKIHDDPEAMFIEGWLLCDAGACDEGAPYLQRAVTKGYFVTETLARSPSFDPLRGGATFDAIAAAAEEGRRRARAAFRDAGGARLLGQ